jgi:hypothetical protein
MNHRLVFWLGSLLGFSLGLWAQGIVVNDPSKSWTVSIPEPPIPRVAAGQSFISFYGHKVTRITDHRSSSDGASWVHYYSDRSPLSRNSTYLCINGSGGSTWIQPMAGGVPKGAAYMVYNHLERPTSIGQSAWSPADDELLYFIGDQVELWSFNARTRKKKMIRDFRKELNQNPFTKEGYLQLQTASRDGKRLMMNYLRMGKECFGLLFYDVSNNSLRVYHGDRIQKKFPAPINPSFRLVGGGADKDGTYVFIQENGQPINGNSPNPQESASTYTYVGKWDENPLAGPVHSLSGLLSTNHGAVMANGHARISGIEAGYINNVDWLNCLRVADVTKNPNPADKFRFPVRDVFFWPYSTGTGAHVSSGLFSDDWLALSVYQETSCGQRINTPMSNEILMISSKAEAVYDDKNHRIPKNGEFHRLTHHYSYPEDCQKPVPYWGQPHAALSMDGKYVVFTSTFGRTGRTDVFVVTLPKHLVPAL